MLVETRSRGLGGAIAAFSGVELVCIFYVDECVESVYCIYINNARKHAQPGRDKALAEGRLV